METLSTVQGQLQRHLSAGSLNEFHGRGGAERVFFVYDLLRDFELFPEILRVEKCDEKSGERRAYGNRLYAQLNYGDALKHYNKAAAYAQSDACLALAYGNRSAVYFQTKMYDYCVRDIDLALGLQPPEGVAGKLRERRLKALESQPPDREEYFLEIPKISEIEPLDREGYVSETLEITQKSGVQTSGALGGHVYDPRTLNYGGPGGGSTAEPSFTTSVLNDHNLETLDREGSFPETLEIAQKSGILTSGALGRHVPDPRTLNSGGGSTAEPLFTTPLLKDHILDREGYFPETLEITQKCEIQTSEAWGRHVTAARTLNPGDVIAAERPFATTLLYEFYLSHCHNCLKAAHNLIPCVKCPLTLYCSSECRQNAWGAYHQHECPLLDTLHHIKATKLQLLALRVVLCSSASNIEIHNLITNEERRTVSDLFGRACVAAIFLYLLETVGYFQGEGVRETTASLLFKHLQTAPSNFHEISEIRGRENTGYEITEIGAGAYAFLSLLNHSCCPNVVRHCHGTVVVLRALKTIQAGEQLLDNYGYHFALMEKTERRTHLKEQYLFDCECEACVNNYPLYSELSRGHKNFVCEENDLNDLLCARRPAALKLLPMTLKHAQEFEMNPEEKRVELLDNQEIMKQCFAILGNKNTLI